MKRHLSFMKLSKWKFYPKSLSHIKSFSWKKFFAYFRGEHNVDWLFCDDCSWLAPSNKVILLFFLFSIWDFILFLVLLGLFSHIWKVSRNPIPFGLPVPWSKLKLVRLLVARKARKCQTRKWVPRFTIYSRKKLKRYASKSGLYIF